MGIASNHALARRRHKGQLQKTCISRLVTRSPPWHLQTMLGIFQLAKPRGPLRALPRATAALLFSAPILAASAAATAPSGPTAAPAAPAAPAARAEAGSPPSRPAVLLELFTSEGCSSCPPADELLAELARSGVVEDTPVIALELHVDYWNYLGWRDPFSDEAYSQRQSAYVPLLGMRGPYTPQLVVNGRFDVLGSSGSRARAAILNASETQTSRSKLSLKLNPQGAGEALHLSASELPRRRVALYAAITESGLQTRVTRGENAGRVLPHGPVVRWLQAVTAGEAGTLSADVPLRLSPSWRKEALQLVAFAQETATGHILAATALPYRPTPASR